jgi:hypothetical protein
MQSAKIALEWIYSAMNCHNTVKSDTEFFELRQARTHKSDTFVSSEYNANVGFPG